MVDRDLVAEERAARQAIGSDGRQSGMDAGTRQLALIAGGIGALLVAMVGGWSLLGQHRAGGIPLIAPPPGPVRIRPADPGGMQLMAGQVAQVNGPAAQALAPGPEAAAPQALQAEVEAARKADAPAAPAATPAKSAIPAGAGPASSPRDPSAVAPAAGPAALPAHSDAPAVGAPTVDASAADVAPVEPAPAGPAPAGSTPTATVPAAPVPPSAGAGARAVQLAALDSEQAARNEWSRLVRQAPALLGDRTPTILHVSRNGRQFYRLRTGGFASTADATAFCARARALGVACALADF